MIEFLKKVFRIKQSELEAKLHPTPQNTFGGVGEVEIELWSDGSATLEAKVKHTGIPDGTTVDVVCADSPVTTLTTMNGYAKRQIKYSEFETPPVVVIGDMAEIRINGETLYQGSFQPD